MSRFSLLSPPGRAGLVLAVVIAAGGLVLSIAAPAPPRDRAAVERLPLVLALAELDSLPLSCVAVDDTTLEVSWPRPASWGSARLRRVGAWVWDVEARRGWWSIPGAFRDAGGEVAFTVPRRTFRSGGRYILRLWAQVDDGRGALARLAPRGTPWQAP